MELRGFAKIESSLLELRIKQWPEFKEFVKTHAVGAYDVDAFLRGAELYYFQGILDSSKVGGSWFLTAGCYFALHPNLNIYDAEVIIHYVSQCGGQSARPAFGAYYLSGCSMEELISKGLLPDTIADVLVESYYGISYSDAIEKRSFNPVNDSPMIAHELCTKINEWTIHFSPEYLPALKLIPFIIEALEYCQLSDLTSSFEWFSDMIRLGVKPEDGYNPKFDGFRHQFLADLNSSAISEDIKALLIGV